MQIKSIVFIVLFISIILQVRFDLGIADHVWQNKRAAVAPTVDVSLGDALMRAGWMAYLRRACPDGAVDEGHAIRHDPLVLDE